MKEKKKFQPMRDVRKAFRIGDSLAITLPADFVREHGIKEGQPIDLIFDGLLKARPLKADWPKEDLEEVVEK